MEPHQLGCGRGPRWVRRVFVVCLLLASSTATAWNVTRSEALVDGERAYSRGDLVAALQHALDHLERQPWNRQAAALAARCLSRMDFSEQAEPYFRRVGTLSLADMQIRAYGLARTAS